MDINKGNSKEQMNLGGTENTLLCFKVHASEIYP